MSESKGEFVASTYVGLLEKIVESPPSDRQLDIAVVNVIRNFLAKGERDSVSVWNFYKQVLDILVHDSAGSKFFFTLFDLEAVYDGPSGSFRQADGSISKAPWRQENAVSAAPWV